MEDRGEIGGILGDERERSGERATQEIVIDDDGEEGVGGEGEVEESGVWVGGRRLWEVVVELDGGGAVGGDKFLDDFG